MIGQDAPVLQIWDNYMLHTHLYVQQCLDAGMNVGNIHTLERITSVIVGLTFYCSRTD